ncbi:MFS general substrate transporter [Bimuria novae-zelandiae CBS 107.79]|uniref:MFS general substrate transporter n=1 Tax=Bimuria novae-zelandiae CBS 107.79 TaxID=1447943 RepID=A0A6A5V1W9_9PLEO|nr:MFS general substrate transporter [Bimuria novae-zelandiae CBS 107.79]
MAYLLFKYIRRKVRETKANKEGFSTGDESHLTPDVARTHTKTQSENHELLAYPGTPTASPHLTQSQLKDTKIEHERLRREEREANIRRWKLIVGLILPNFLASVDVTIVAPAIPTISSHFNHLSGSFNWIVAAYTLTFTTFVPASGQLADIYGRHFALHFQMFWILIGSVLCASSVTWGMLLFGRALQGLGAAGIMNLTRIILSDGMSLADNSKNNTVFSLINGISYAVGPVVGGYLASSSWRYCFVLPIPLAVLSHLFFFLLMRNHLFKARVTLPNAASRRTRYVTSLAHIDWPGMTTFILGIGLIILAIQWGGTSYAWSSAATIAPLVLGGLLVLTFFVHEYLLGAGRFTARLFPRQTPMIPSSLFRKKDTTLLLLINFSAGVSLVSAFYFVSYYWQLAEGYTSSRAGTQLLYYTPGLGVGVYSTLFMCNVWPKQTFYPLFIGSIVEAGGLAAMTWAISARNTTLVSVFLAVAGAGTGFRFMPVVLHAAGIFPDCVTAMQSVLSFSLPLGETVGISMMGAVFSNKFSGYLRSLGVATGAGSTGTAGLANLEALAGLQGEAQKAVRNAAARAIMWGFVSVMPFMALSIVASAFIGNVWIGNPKQVGKDGKVKKEESKGMVMTAPFLLAVCTGSIQRQRKEVDPITEQSSREKKAKIPDVEAADPRPAQVAQVRDGEA